MKALGAALVLGGALLLWWGYDQSQGLSQQLNEAFTGSYSREVMWKYVGGAAAAAAGVVLLVRR